MKTVIEMAREAGIIHPEMVDKTLERFAELVRADSIADEREKLAAWMIQRGYSIGHGNTTKDLLDELDWQVVQNWTSAMKTGVETEREQCAQLCEQGLAIATSLSALDDMEMWGEKFAAAIRARSNT